MSWKRDTDTLELNGPSANGFSEHITTSSIREDDFKGHDNKASSTYSNNKNSANADLGRVPSMSNEWHLLASILHRLVLLIYAVVALLALVGLLRAFVTS